MAARYYRRQAQNCVLIDNLEHVADIDPSEILIAESDEEALKKLNSLTIEEWGLPPDSSPWRKENYCSGFVLRMNKPKQAVQDQSLDDAVAEAVRTCKPVKYDQNREQPDPRLAALVEREILPIETTGGVGFFWLNAYGDLRIYPRYKMVPRRSRNKSTKPGAYALHTQVHATNRGLYEMLRADPDLSFIVSSFDTGKSYDTHFKFFLARCRVAEKIFSRALVKKKALPLLIELRTAIKNHQRTIKGTHKKELLAYTAKLEGKRARTVPGRSGAAASSSLPSAPVV